MKSNQEIKSAWIKISSALHVLEFDTFLRDEIDIIVEVLKEVMDNKKEINNATETDTI